MSTDCSRIPRRCTKQDTLLRRLLVLAGAAVLSGCAQAMWIDTTGHHRSGERAKADYKACTAETAAVGPNPTYDETEAARARLLVCMYSHGWRARSLQHL